MEVETRPGQILPSIPGRVPGGAVLCERNTAAGSILASRNATIQVNGETETQ